MPDGHWERDGQEFYFTEDLLEDFRENLYEMDDIDFESWLDDEYSVASLFYRVYYDGADSTDSYDEYYEYYMGNLPSPLRRRGLGDRLRYLRLGRGRR